MWGSWFALTFGFVVVLAILIGFSVLASPLIAFLLVVIAIGALVAAFVARRGGKEVEEGEGGGAARSGNRSSFDGGPSPLPPSSGAPASGEGEARGGEAATPPLR